MLQDTPYILPLVCFWSSSNGYASHSGCFKCSYPPPPPPHTHTPRNPLPHPQPHPPNWQSLNAIKALTKTLHRFLWDVILLHNLTSTTIQLRSVEFKTRMSHYIPLFYMDIITYPLPNCHASQLISVVKEVAGKRNEASVSGHMMTECRSDSSKHCKWCQLIHTGWLAHCIALHLTPCNWRKEKGCCNYHPPVSCIDKRQYFI